MEGLCSCWRKLSALRVDPFSEETRCAGAQTGNYKMPEDLRGICSPFKTHSLRKQTYLNILKILPPKKK